MDSEKSLTSAVEAENYVAGSILIDEKAYFRICDKLNPEMFQYDVCRSVFEAASRLAAAGKKIDPVTVLEDARNNGTPIDRNYAAELIDATPTSARAELYADAVADHAKRRELNAVAERILNDGNKPTDQLITEVSLDLERLGESAIGTRLLGSFELATHFYQSLEDRENGKRNVVPTGYSNLDRILGGGMLNGGFYICAARPGIGKTTLALNIADRIQSPSLFVSLEMSPEQLVAKRVAREAGVPAYKLLMGGGLSEKEWKKVAEATGEISRKSVTVNRRIGATVAEIGLMARQIKGLSVVFIDYLGLIRSDIRGDRYQSITRISNDLKRLAIALDVPVFCLAQLNRASQQRGDKRPVLSDLRDSGAIEQDADAVLLLHRSDSENDEEQKAYAPVSVECIVAKNRHAGTGVVWFNAYLGTSKFLESR